MMIMASSCFNSSSRNSEAKILSPVPTNSRPALTASPPPACSATRAVGKETGAASQPSLQDSSAG